MVSVLNFFRENETVYMVMNYLQGDTLQDFIVTARDLKRDKVFRESTIRSLFDEILRGLRIVHQHKMLHLDIKPANVFITNDNKAVMLDFGAARRVISGMTQAQLLAITPMQGIALKASKLVYLSADQKAAIQAKMVMAGPSQNLLQILNAQNQS